jgi:uncharacterized protein (TIRG00374 family)
MLATTGILSGAAAYFAVRDVRLRDVGHALASSSYGWLVPAAAAFVLGNVFRVVRWRLLFAPERRPGARPAAEAFLVGQLFNIVLPARAGEVTRIVALNARTRGSRAEAAATILLERVYDVLGLLLLLFVVLPWLPGVSWLREAVYLAVALTAAVVALAVVVAIWADRPLRLLVGPLARLPFWKEERVESAVANLTHGLAAARTVRLAVGALVWTVAAWLAIGLSCWLAMLAFDLGLSPLAGVFVVATVGLSMILPSAPAALGVFEAAVVATLAAYGTGRATALSYALVLHALHVLPLVAAGMGVLHARGLSFWRGRPDAVLARRASEGPGSSSYSGSSSEKWRIFSRPQKTRPR